jgi:hypothetical protein
MSQKVCQNLPVIIGGAALVIILDLIVLLLRTAGLEKGMALYVTALVAAVIGRWLVHRSLHRT